MTTTFRFYTEVLLRILPETDYAIALEQLAEVLPLRIAAVDAAGRVVVWNGAMEAWAGPRRAALGRPLLDALPRLREDANVDWAAALETVLAHRNRLEIPRHPVGNAVMRVVLAPLGPEPVGVSEHDALGAVLVLEDITDRVRTEERRMLQVRSDAVEALGAGIAHEVRNPLNALSLNLQLLRERLEDPRADRDDLVAKADAMIAELKRMDALVTHLLEVSRGGPPSREPRRLDEIVAAVVERLRPTAAQARASLAFEPGSRRVLRLDAARIDRALHNLVRNGLEAVPPGGHVWVTTRDDPHSTVVGVEDDGPGIPAEDRARMFELFFTRKRGGTGLGLPLARRAIEDHGGEIEVLERPGGGARFLVHLPHDPRAATPTSATSEEPGWRGS